MIYIYIYTIVLQLPITIACEKGCLGLNTGIRFHEPHLILSSPISLSSLQNSPYTHISLINPFKAMPSFHINYYIYA